MIKLRQNIQISSKEVVTQDASENVKELKSVTFSKSLSENFSKLEIDSYNDYITGQEQQTSLSTLIDYGGVVEIPLIVTNDNNNTNEDFVLFTPESFSVVEVVDDALENQSLIDNSIYKIVNDNIYSNNLDIKILSHEIIKAIPGDTETGFNLTFLSSHDVTNKTFLELNKNKIDKFESYFDRTSLLIDVNKHENILRDRYKRSLDIIEKLDNISILYQDVTLNVNYGNVVRDWCVKRKKSEENGFVSKKILSKLKSDVDLIGVSLRPDDSLLDTYKKESGLDVFSNETLEVFYSEILGFNYEDSFLNFGVNRNNSFILNSDKLVGQVLYCNSIAMNCIFPNADNFQNNSFLKLSREIVDSKALDFLPLIKINEISPNCYITSNIESVLSSINKGLLNKSRIIENSVLKPRSNILAQFIENNTYSFGSREDLRNDYTLIYGPILENRYNNTGRVQKSLAFQTSPNSPNTTVYHNCYVFTIKCLDGVGNIIEAPHEILHFNANANKGSRYSPSYLSLPQNYFINFGFARGPFARSRPYTDNTKIAQMSDSAGSINDNFESLFELYDQGNIRDDFDYNQSENAISIKLSKVLNSGDQEDSVYNRVIKYELSKNLAKRYVSSFNLYDENLGKPRIIKKLLQDRTSLIENAVYERDRINVYYSDKIKSRLNDLYTRDYNSELEDAYAYVREDSGAYYHALAFPEDGLAINASLRSMPVYRCSNSFISKDTLINMFKNVDYYEPSFDDRESLTYQGFISERLLNDQNSNTEFVNKILLDYKTSIDYYNEYKKDVLSISSAVNNLRREMSPKVFDKFDKFINNAKNKIANEKKYSLLYGKRHGDSFEVYSDSKFIDNNYTRNNFAKVSFDIKNTTEKIMDNANISSEGHLFSSKEYREFLKNSYPISYMRNKSSLLEKLILENIDVFNNSTYSNDEYFGFDVMLAMCLSEDYANDAKKVIEVIKMIMFNAVVKYAGIDEQINKLKIKPNLNLRLNSRSSNLTNYSVKKDLEGIFGKERIDKIIRTVFDPMLIKKLNNFVARPLTYPSEEAEININTSPTEKSKDSFYFRNLPGYLINLTFPFNFEDISLNYKILLRNYSEILSIGNTVLYDPLLEMQEQCDLLQKHLTYRHDTYILQDKTGISYFEDVVENEESKNILKGFTYEEKFKQNSGSDLQICYLVGNFSGEEESVSFDVAPRDSDTQGLRTIEGTTDNYPIVRKTFCKEEKSIIPFSYFYNDSLSKSFSRSLTRITEDLIKTYDIDVSSVVDIDSANQFVENNIKYTKILKDIFSTFSKIFLESYNNYLSILISAISRKAYDGNVSEEDPSHTERHSGNNLFDEFKNLFSYANGNIDIIKSSTKDLQSLVKKISQENDNSIDMQGYFEETVFDLNSIISNDDFEDAFSFRQDKLYEVYRILKNSDICEAISHDIIHGYFLNFENNVKNTQNNFETLKNEIQNILSESEKIDSTLTFDKIKDLLTNNYYKNKLSKKLQEEMYYKNIFNETFIENDYFNSTREKYNTINAFNHRKLYNENVFQGAMFGLDYINNALKIQKSEGVDLIKIPINHDLSKVLSDRLLKISIQPINPKYPEIEYKKIFKFYSPVLTEVTSNFVGLENMGSIFNFVGIYDNTLKISDRYSVIDYNTAVSEVSDIILQSNISRNNEESALQTGLAHQIVESSKLSSAIKYIEKISQEAIVESVKLVDNNNIVSGNVLELFNNISIESLENIFERQNIEIKNSTQEYIQINRNRSILKNKDHVSKFMSEVSRDMSEVDIINAIIPDVYYDIFSILIPNSSILIQDDLEAIRFRDPSFVNNDESKKHMMYYIELEIL